MATRKYRRKTHVAAVDGPHPVDRHVGQRILLQRKLLGVTQTALANQLAVSFQQVQRYERGANRVSASMLMQIAYALRVPVGFFFDDYRYEGENLKAETEADPLHSSLELRLLVAGQAFRR